MEETGSRKYTFGRELQERCDVAMQCNAERYQILTAAHMKYVRGLLRQVEQGVEKNDSLGMNLNLEALHLTTERQSLEEERDILEQRIRDVEVRERLLEEREERLSRIYEQGEDHARLERERGLDDRELALVRREALIEAQSAEMDAKVCRNAQPQQTIGTHEAPSTTASREAGCKETQTCLHRY